MIEVRNAVPEDSTVLFDLIKGLAIHHNQLSYLKSNKDHVAEAISNDKINYKAMLAYYDGKIAGCLSFSINYSIWAGAYYMHIDDVFVLKKYRSKNIGTALMSKARNVCRAEGLQMIKWEVELENTKAINFYKKLGAGMSSKGFFKWNVDG